MHPAFTQTKHRPWPLPQGNWLLKQQWLDLLFVHWEVDAHFLREHIPEPLEIDYFEDKAWLAVVPFDMKGVSFRKAPTFPPLSNFPEINVRTYVTYQDKPGVWFFSLDVPQRFAAWTARTFFHLPYRFAEVSVSHNEEAVRYSHRFGDQQFEATYKPLKRLDAKPGTFEHWATERYCLYCDSKRGDLFRTEVHHPKWPLYTTQYELHKNTLLDPFPVGEQHPSVLFSKHLNVVAYPPEKLTVAQAEVDLQPSTAFNN